jgi:hypothetical protein
MPNLSPIPNLIDLAFPPDKLQSCQGALATLTDVFPGVLVDIGPDLRQSLTKYGPGSESFILRAMVLMRAMPQYKPGYVDIDAFQRDLDALALLGPMRDQLRKCLDLVDDSMMLAGADAYTVARAFYKALRAAAGSGSLDAQVAADDLGSRLPARALSKRTPTPGAPTPSGTPTSNGA